MVLSGKNLSKIKLISSKYTTKYGRKNYDEKSVSESNEENNVKVSKRIKRENIMDVSIKEQNKLKRKKEKNCKTKSRNLNEENENDYMEYSESINKFKKKNEIDEVNINKTKIKEKHISKNFFKFSEKAENESKKQINDEYIENLISNHEERYRNVKPKKRKSVSKEAETYNEKNNESSFRFDSPPRETTASSSFSSYFRRSSLSSHSSTSVYSDASCRKKTNHLLFKKRYNFKKITDTTTALNSEKLNYSKSDNHYYSYDLLENTNSLTSKAARELYVGNLPVGLDVRQLLEFLNSALNAFYENSHTFSEEYATKGWISTDNHFAFVEFKNLQHASNCILLNGIFCLGKNLRIGRPKTFPAELNSCIPPPTIFALDVSYLSKGIEGIHQGVQEARKSAQLFLNSSSLKASSPSSSLSDNYIPCERTNVTRAMKPQRLCLYGFSSYITEEKLKNLMITFGDLEFIKLIFADNINETICLFAYKEYESEIQAIRILSENTKYQIISAELAFQQNKISSKVLNRYIKNEYTNLTYILYQIPTRVILLRNLITMQHLLDDNVYNEVKEDIWMECETYGKVQSIEIPKLNPLKFLFASNFLNYLPNSIDNQNKLHEKCFTDDIGKVFVEFEDVESAGKARKFLNGRKFDDRVVEVHFFNYDKFKNKEFTNVSPNFDEKSFFL